MSLPLLHLTGSPYEQGYQHGYACRDQIAHNLAIYFNYFEREGLPRSDVLRTASRYAAAIATQNREYYRSMEGVAAGSNLSFTDIVALNIRYELIYQLFTTNMMAETPRADGCTAFAVLHSAPDDHLLIGQNWDWIPEVAGVLLHTSEPNGLQTLAFSEAGIVGGKIGMNTAGLGLAINGLNATTDSFRTLSKPFHVRCYEILRQPTIEEAVAVVTSSRRACSANFLIAQTPHHLVNIEAASEVVNLLSWQDGSFVHANHFLEPARIGVTEPESDYYHSSHARCERMNTLLDSEPQVTISSIQRHLQDHSTAPYSICAHENPNVPQNMRECTLVSIVMDLHEQVMYLTDGVPCQNDYQAFQL